MVRKSIRRVGVTKIGEKSSQLELDEAKTTFLNLKNKEIIL